MPWNYRKKMRCGTGTGVGCLVVQCHCHDSRGTGLGIALASSAQNRQWFATGTKIPEGCSSQHSRYVSRYVSSLVRTYFPHTGMFPVLVLSTTVRYNRTTTGT